MDLHARESGRRSRGHGKVQAGEQAANLLAESITADMILLDERSARHVASDRGLRATGTLGEGAARGVVDLATAIDHLGKTNFRYSPAISGQV
jgi:predicted nucleic acid-binding protein